ncbi:hypothetical protein [Streptomyces paromomycinus]|uniref:hypothetical protein n=1 Tax=Streptomyces paromomycinus TaxID=92743 RepID=UPI000F627CE9|nr:hypothetical protein [Streptomyces paromomycinus]
MEQVLDVLPQERALVGGEDAAGGAGQEHQQRVAVGSAIVTNSVVLIPMGKAASASSVRLAWRRATRRRLGGDGRRNGVGEASDLRRQPVDGLDDLAGGVSGHVGVPSRVVGGYDSTVGVRGGRGGRLLVGRGGGSAVGVR